MNSNFFLRIPQSMPFQDFFNDSVAVWEWIPLISKVLAQFDFLPVDQELILPRVTIVGDVYLHPTVEIYPGVVIEGPAWIGPHTKIRPGAFIRGNVIIGAHCIVGHQCEYKNCLLMDNVTTPHFNYIGDSILGSRAHLGAGAILSNVRLDEGTVRLKLPDGSIIDTGLRKLGAILGEGAQVGCNAVLQPGTILGEGSFVGPAMAFGGYLPARHKALSASRALISQIN